MLEAITIHYTPCFTPLLGVECVFVQFITHISKPQSFTGQLTKPFMCLLKMMGWLAWRCSVTGGKEKQLPAKMVVLPLVKTHAWL